MEGYCAALGNGGARLSTRRNSSPALALERETGLEPADPQLGKAFEASEVKRLLR
jgi:hypothetical protein